MGIINIRIWYMANVQGYPFYKVTYKDGITTYPLHYSEAKGLSRVFNGKLWIDYDYGKYYLNYLKKHK